MLENDAQKPESYSPHMKSNAPEEVSESIEEPDQRSALPHQKSSSAVYSAGGGQSILAGCSVGETV